jgi:hypothetical protein
VKLPGATCVALILLLAAIQPALAQSIVGSWIPAGQNMRDEGASVLVFMADGHYYQVQNARVAEGPSGFDGFERGTYTWNAQTGAAGFTTLQDTNGDTGISAPGGVSGFRFTVSGDTAIATSPDPQEEPRLFQRVVGSTPIVGGWRVGDPGAPDSSAVVVFLSNGVYLMAQDAEPDAMAQDGIEHGSYTWNSSNGQFGSSRQPAPFVDTNGEYGLSHLGSNVVVQVSGSGAMLTLSLDDEDVEFERIGAAPSAAGEFQINEGLSGAWYEPATSGQGFLINVLPDTRTVFLAWFTYDVDRPDGTVGATIGDPGHRWFTAYGAYQGAEALLELTLTEYGVFDASPPVPENSPAGTLLLEFSNCSEGTATYELPGAGLQGSIPIQRIALENVPLCEALDARAN